MTEKEKQVSQTLSSANDVGTAADTEAKKDNFEERLAGLPEKYREEILKQYDMPDVKVTLFGVLRHATWVEILLMVAGTFLSIASGPYSSQNKRQA